LAVLALIEDWTPATKLTPQTIKTLQDRAIVNIYSCSGVFRDGPVRIHNVEHQPPDSERVESLVDDLCDYINRNWETATAVHLASYAVWRLNWIHPFFGGNGRTSRAISYLVLCAKLGFRLPGNVTVTEQIVKRRDAYINALQSADAAWLKQILDLSAMENLMECVIAAQLLDVVKQATGRDQQ
jgi:Fic family protein